MTTRYFLIKDKAIVCHLEDKWRDEHERKACKHPDGLGSPGLPPEAAR
jgi:hypothetical protein